MITLNQPKTIATEQNYRLTACNINFEQGIIEVNFIILNENGKYIGKLTKQYSGQGANDYWADFVSKQFMYERMVEEENLEISVPVIPDVLVEN